MPKVTAEELLDRIGEALEYCRQNHQDPKRFFSDKHRTECDAATNNQRIKAKASLARLRKLVDGKQLNYEESLVRTCAE